jgi:hypothetical protein
MTSIESIANSLGGAKKTATGYLCRCPCHDDKTASLSIALGANGLMLNCFAGCSWQDIKEELSRRGLASSDNAKDQSHNETKNTIYEYRDQSGTLIFQKVRVPGKGFFIRRPDGGGGWINDLKTVDNKPLYNLPAILQSIKDNQPIAILEGEKDCDNFTKLTGIPATCNFDGASKDTQKPKWKSAYSEQLAGAEVFLFYDNDSSGIAHKNSIVLSLKSHAKSIVVGHLPESLDDKPIKDFSDWMNAGGSREDVKGLKFEVVKEVPKGIEVLDTKEWLKLPEAPSDPILCNLFDAGDKVVIIGQSKTRKSFFALQLALSLASGRGFLGFISLEKKKVLLVQSEIKKDRYHVRCVKMTNRLNIDPDELESLLIVNSRGAPSQQLLIEKLVEEHKPDVVIIDPFYKLLAGDESKSEDVKPILQFFDSLAEKSGAAIVYVHHDKKGVSGDQQLTDRGSGTGIIGRDFDSAVYLSPHRDLENELVVEFITRNHIPQNPISIEWEGYGFNTSSSVPLKRTTRSAAREPRATLMTSVTMVKEKLSRLAMTEMRMSLLNTTLDELGLPLRIQGAVKEQLIDEGVLEVYWSKGTKGKTVKMVKIDLNGFNIGDSSLNSSDF